MSDVWHRYVIDLFALQLFLNFVGHKNIGDNKVFTECDFPFVEAAILQFDLFLIGRQRNKPTWYTYEIIHISRTNFENSVKEADLGFEQAHLTNFEWP